MAVHHALEVATPPSDLFDELGSPQFAILAQHFRAVLWSFGYDSKRLSSETLFEAAGNQLRRDFTPWYLYASKELIARARLALADVLIDVRAAHQARNDDLLFWGLHCYVAQLLLGDSISEAQIRLDAASTFLDATIHSFASAGERLPNLRASQLVLLSGGAPAYWHINGILSTMSAGRLSKLVDLELARRAVPIKSGAACFYKLEGSTKLSFCLPDVFSICKSPRPECGHGMKEDYIQAEHVLGGDFTAGCKLSVLLRDRWEAQLQSTSIDLEVEAAACVFGLGRNNYNPDVISELGVDAAGTHYYHSWFRDLKITLGEPYTSVVVPFDLLDFSVANAPDGKDVAKHFRMTVAAALDHFAPSSIFMRWAVPREAVFKSFTSGTDWSVGAVFFMGSIQADMVQRRAVVGAVSFATPTLTLIELSAESDEAQLSSFHSHLEALQTKWTDAGLRLDAHPITHVVVDGIQQWLHRQPFNFNENPGFCGRIEKLVMSVRVDNSGLYSLAALAVSSKHQSRGTRQAAPAAVAFLLSLYTDPNHERQGFAREALGVVSAYLDSHMMTACVPLHSCINRFTQSASYRKLFEQAGWIVSTVDGARYVVQFTPSASEPSRSLLHPSVPSIVMQDHINDKALWTAYIASPMLAVAMCVTERGRYLQSGKWTTCNVGCAFAIALARCFAGSIIIDIVQARPEPGGLRDSQLRAMRAPPKSDGGDWKVAASDEARRASDFLIRQHQHHGIASTRHTPLPLDLMLSLSGEGTAYPQWREAVAFAAQRYSASGVILTLIPDFWRIDPNHRDYPGMWEKRKHRATH